MNQKLLNKFESIAKLAQQQVERIEKGLPIEVCFDYWLKSDFENNMECYIEDNEIDKEHFDKTIEAYMTDVMVNGIDANESNAWDDIQDKIIDLL